MRHYCTPSAYTAARAKRPVTYREGSFFGPLMELRRDNGHVYWYSLDRDDYELITDGSREVEWIDPDKALHVWSDGRRWVCAKTASEAAGVAARAGYPVGAAPFEQLPDQWIRAIEYEDGVCERTLFDHANNGEGPRVLADIEEQDDG